MRRQRARARRSRPCKKLNSLRATPTASRTTLHAAVQPAARLRPRLEGQSVATAPAGSCFLGGRESWRRRCVGLRYGGAHSSGRCGLPLLLPDSRMCSCVAREVARQCRSMVNRPGRPLGCDQVALMAVTVERRDYGVRSRDEPSAPAVEPIDLLLICTCTCTCCLLVWVGPMTFEFV